MHAAVLPSGYRSQESCVARRCPGCEEPADGGLPAGVTDDSLPLPEVHLESASLPVLLADARLRDQQPREGTCTGVPAWLDTDLGIPPARRRTRLPEPKQKLPELNVFSLVKDWIGEGCCIAARALCYAEPAYVPGRPALCSGCTGKDIHKLCLPTHVNEPLTELQKRAEIFQSSELLDEVAFNCAEPTDACMQHVHTWMAIASMLVATSTS